MNLHEYLRRRSKFKNANALTHPEARLLKMPWPLPKGWPSKYGNIEIDQTLLDRLDNALQKRRDKVSNKKARRESENNRIRSDIEERLGRPLSAPVVPVVAKQTSIVKPPKVKKPATGDGFYMTREWRELRYKALVINGAKCQCCGATRNDGVRLHVDHIKPRSKFQKLQLELSNLQVLCEDCNLGKSNKDSTDWR